MKIVSITQQFCIWYLIENDKYEIYLLENFITIDDEIHYNFTFNKFRTIKINTKNNIEQKIFEKYEK